MVLSLTSLADVASSLIVFHKLQDSSDELDPSTTVYMQFWVTIALLIAVMIYSAVFEKTESKTMSPATMGWLSYVVIVVSVVFMADGALYSFYLSCSSITETLYGADDDDSCSTFTQLIIYWWNIR